MRYAAASALSFIALFAACGGSSDTTTVAASTASSSASSSSSSGTGGSGGASGCTLTDNTTPTATMSPSGCAVRTRDTTACEADRKTAGLTGFWLKFSCRVTLSKGANTIDATSDDLPDYESNYFPANDPCHEAYDGAIQNPNFIKSHTLKVSFPIAPDMTQTKMMGAVVAMAINGVGIFGNFAAPGDDIYQEAQTFDRCGGHPQMSGQYHYHTEPFAISYDDSELIGVMRDGYPIYGRRDMDGSMPTLDALGGHTGVTADSGGASVYHYHVNQQTSMNPGTLGKTAWFLTTGNYRGAPAACTTCN